jgi:hypothetical protein
MSKKRKSGYIPGEDVLDKYMPNASPQDPEIARECLYDLGRVMLRIAVRQAREERADSLTEAISL